jgi:putative ABC transport system ATP-binding protein
MGPVSAPAAVLSLRDLKFRWPRASHDLIDIEALDVQSGETLFVHGPSGCGKSTLLSLLPECSRRAAAK